MSLSAQRLDECLRDGLVLIGIGNRWRGDDAAGPAVIERVAGRVRAQCIDAGDAPERHLGEATQGAPQAILLVDAVDFGGRPGEIAAFSRADLPARLGTTHDVSLAVLMRYLEETSGATTLLVGIQPSTRPLVLRSEGSLLRRVAAGKPAPVGANSCSPILGDTMSPEVVAGVEALAALLLARLPCGGAGAR